jgi:hypothetical protein
MKANIAREPVDPARLACGQWCQRANKTLGEGDIRGSYSADRIGMGKPVRRPFTFRGSLFVCTGYSRDGAEAYRLVHPAIFPGKAFRYAERTRNGDEVRADPDGFYHGMIVRHGAADHVLCGPPVLFIKGRAEQLSLF